MFGENDEASVAFSSGAQSDASQLICRHWGQRKKNVQINETQANTSVIRYLIRNTLIMLKTDIQIYVDHIE